MAQPRFCSMTDCDKEAAILITFLDSGTTMDLCDAHWGLFVIGGAESMGMVWPAEEPATGEPEPETAPEEATPDTGDAADEPIENPPAGTPPAGLSKGARVTRARRV